MCILQEQARLRMMKEKGSDKADMFWNNLWGKPKDLSSGIGREIAKGFYKCYWKIYSICQWFPFSIVLFQNFISAIPYQ